MTQPLTWDSGLVWDSLAPEITWDGLAPTNPILRPMANDNRISLELTPAQKTAITTAVADLKTALDGILTNLNVDERQSLPKIGDKTLAFDEKCQAYMASRPELVPSFLDMAEMVKDRQLVADLRPCLLELQQLVEGLDDTITLANSDNLMGDLAFYQNVRAAAKRGVPGTDTILNDLKERFPGRPRATPPPPTDA